MSQALSRLRTPMGDTMLKIKICVHSSAKNSSSEVTFGTSLVFRSGSGLGLWYFSKGIRRVRVGDMVRGKEWFQ